MSAYTAAAQAHKSGEITKEQFDEIKKGFNKYESDMHNLYKSAVQTEIGKESGVGLLTNADEVNRKKHNLAKGLEGAFDNLSVNINDGISTAYTELGASKSIENYNNWYQNRQLMKNQKERDEALYPILSDFLQYGIKDEYLAGLNKKWGRNKQWQ